MKLSELKKAIKELSFAEIEEVLNFTQETCEIKREEGTNWEHKRAHARYSCKFRAAFVRHTPLPETPSDERGTQKGLVNDISKGGVSLSIQVKLSPGEVMTVVFESGSGIERKAYVEVRRCIPAGDGYNAGMMFITRKELEAAVKIYWDKIDDPQLYTGGD